MFLIHPPVVKPTEPPPGIARLSGALSAHGIQHTIIDANLEGLYYLLDENLNKSKVPNSIDARNRGIDTWTKRALRTISANIERLKTWDVYANIDRYRRTVSDLNRAVNKSSDTEKMRISLVDYVHRQLSPVKSTDIIFAAEHPEDNPFYPYFKKRIIEAVENSKDKNRLVFGFSLNYLSQVLTTFAMVGFVKGVFPKSRIIVGGGLITSWMKNPSWANPFKGLVDYPVAGPGETQLLSILGIESRKQEHYLPCYDGFRLGGYLAPGFILAYSTSAGCYWGKCSFCPETAEGSKYRQAEPDMVCRDLQTLSSSLKPALIHLTDNALSPLMLKKIIENPPGVPWYGFARFTSHLKDRGFCEALKSSGCVMLKLGLESGNQGVIDYMNKGISLDTASVALKTLKNAGIPTYIYLLFGTPKETINEARHTLDFIVEHAEYIDFLNLAIFNMPLRSLETIGLSTEKFYEGDLSLYTDFIHPEGWGRLNARRFLEGEFKKHPEIKSIIQRHPPLFTSNHAPLFRMKQV